jgi:hypothetical protein
MVPPGPAVRSYERLERMLKELGAVHADLQGDELQQLAEQVKRAVLKLQNVLKRTQVNQVAALVQTEQWAKASEQLQRDLPGGSTSIGNVEEVLELVYMDDNLANLTRAILWAGQLEPQLRRRAYEALYEQMQIKGHTEQPQVLMLRRRVAILRPVSVLKAQLDGHCQEIVLRVVQGIKDKDYTLTRQIVELHDYVEGELITNEIMAEVVAKFDVGILMETLLLIQYCEKLPAIGNCCVFIDTVLKSLEAKELMASEQALQIWATAKYVEEEEPHLKEEHKQFQKLCTKALDKLSKFKADYFQHYQSYVENKNLKQLHRKNCFLRSIVPEFVTWYYKPEDLSRVQKLLVAVRATDFAVIQRTLTQLHCEMQKFEQINSSEAFFLFCKVKQNLALRSLTWEEPEMVDAFELLKSHAPKCLRLLLWPEEGSRLRVVNKFYDSPLWVQGEELFCFSGAEEEEQVCTASVDPKTALTTFSFKSGDACWKLDAFDSDSVARVKLIGAPWKLKAVDEQHVKIFTNDGTFFLLNK